MKVCGFSFVRNGIKFEYPFREALLSILPLCEEVYVAVGKSDDDTLEVVKSLHPKIKVIETEWDETLKDGGHVFADETNKAFASIPADYDWAFYIQGDEVLHEKYISPVKNAMEQNLNNLKIDGLLLDYIHFFGSYEYVGTKYSWYRREVRIIRNNKNIYSYKDAQGFRKNDNKKLNVKLVDAYIYHYGWVREPKAMAKKLASSETLYHGGTFTEKDAEGRQYKYDNVPEPVMKFEGTHPALMQERVKKISWKFNPDPHLKYISFKDWLKRKIYALTGWMPGEYKNYILKK